MFSRIPFYSLFIFFYYGGSNVARVQKKKKKKKPHLDLPMLALKRPGRGLANISKKKNNNR